MKTEIKITNGHTKIELHPTNEFEKTALRDAKSMTLDTEIVRTPGRELFGSMDKDYMLVLKCERTEKRSAIDAMMFDKYDLMDCLAWFAKKRRLKNDPNMAEIEEWLTETQRR